MLNSILEAQADINLIKQKKDEESQLTDAQTTDIGNAYNGGKPVQPRL